MALAIREILTDRLLEASGAWTDDERRALRFDSFLQALRFKKRKHLELAQVIELPRRFPLKTGVRLSDSL